MQISAQPSQEFETNSLAWKSSSISCPLFRLTESQQNLFQNFLVYYHDYNLIIKKKMWDWNYKKHKHNELEFTVNQTTIKKRLIINFLLIFFQKSKEI